VFSSPKIGKNADMANVDVKNTRVAILVAEGFEEVEMTKPREALEAAGAQTSLVSPENGRVQANRHQDKGEKFEVDVPLSRARPEDYDALLLPGGVANPDKLRTLPEAVQFVRAFFDDGKPVAAICHAPWSLIEAEVVRGRRITSWPSLKTDLRNAGASWVDEQVVIDDNLVTSRKPDDIPAFNEAMLTLFAKRPTTAGSRS
jgi:protease I